MHGNCGLDDRVRRMEVRCYCLFPHFVYILFVHDQECLAYSLYYFHLKVWKFCNHTFHFLGYINYTKKWSLNSPCVCSDSENVRDVCSPITNSAVLTFNSFIQVLLS